MSYLSAFFEFCYKCLKMALTWQVTAAGLILSAIGSCVTFIATIFSNFSWLQWPTTWLDAATTQLQLMINNSMPHLAQVLLRCFAIDTLVQLVGTVIACTVGVVVLVCITLLVSLVALLPVLLGVKAVLKAIRVATLGVADP